MADLRVHSNPSNIVRFILKHSTTGQGLTGLSNVTSGLIIAVTADNEATATAYTVAGGNVETITTLGTFATPTAGKCRFQEFDATNHRGKYEFQFADARFAVANARRLVISVTGAANLLDTDYEIQLLSFNLYAAIAQTGDSYARLGAPAGASVSADVAAVKSDTSSVKSKTDSLTFTVSNVLDANALRVGGTAQTARDLGASVLLSNGTGTGEVKLASGYVSPNWGDVGNPTTTVGLTGTTVAATQKVDVETIKTNPVVNAGTITFPTTATLASTTNITAGTITTVTNLTNAPTVGDLTAAMKASVNAEADTALADVGVTTTVTGRIDAAVTSRLATAGYTAPDNAMIGTINTKLGTPAATVSADIADLPTNAELAAALAAADDAVLAALAALNNLAAGAAMTLTTGERDAIASALLDLTNGVEAGRTVRQSLRLGNAANGGKTDGMATTTAHLRDLADTKNRVTATVDADGNRTAVTLDLT